MIKKRIKTINDIVIWPKEKFVNSHVAITLHHTDVSYIDGADVYEKWYTFFVDVNKQGKIKDIWQNFALGDQNWGQFAKLVDGNGNHTHIAIGIKGDFEGDGYDRKPDPVTEDIKKVIRQLQRWINLLLKNDLPLPLVPHRKIDRTLCPGKEMMKVLQSGELYINNNYDKKKYKALLLEIIRKEFEILSKDIEKYKKL